MDNVRLLKKHLKDFEEIPITSELINTEWVDTEGAPVPFKAAPFPLNADDLKMFSEGEMSLDDLKIYTKYEIKGTIKKRIKRIETGEVFEMAKNKPYKEIADLKVYILKLWKEE